MTLKRILAFCAVLALASLATVRIARASVVADTTAKFSFLSGKTDYVRGVTTTPRFLLFPWENGPPQVSLSRFAPTFTLDGNYPLPRLMPGGTTFVERKWVLSRSSFNFGSNLAGPTGVFYAGTIRVGGSSTTERHDAASILGAIGSRPFSPRQPT